MQQRQKASALGFLTLVRVELRQYLNLEFIDLHNTAELGELNPLVSPLKTAGRQCFLSLCQGAGLLGSQFPPFPNGQLAMLKGGQMPHVSGSIDS